MGREAQLVSTSCPEHPCTLVLLLKFIYTVKKGGGEFKKIGKISILPDAECFLGKH